MCMASFELRAPSMELFAVLFNMKGEHWGGKGLYIVYWVFAGNSRKRTRTGGRRIEREAMIVE